MARGSAQGFDAEVQFFGDFLGALLFKQVVQQAMSSLSAKGGQISARAILASSISPACRRHMLTTSVPFSRT